MKNNQQGRSMIEMLGVLAIVGLLSMAGISLYTKALYQRKVSTTIDQISELITNMRNIYRSRRSYEFPDWSKGPEADTKKIIPDSMWVNDKEGWKIKTEIHSKVYIYSEDPWGKDTGKIFTIVPIFETMTKDDVNTCIKIATSDWGNNVKICIGSNDEKNCNCKEPSNCNTVMSMENAFNACYSGLNSSLKIGFIVK